MGNRFYNSRYPTYKRFAAFWWGTRGSTHTKNRYNRLSRRAWKREINNLHVRRGLSSAYSEVKYKGW